MAASPMLAPLVAAPRSTQRNNTAYFPVHRLQPEQWPTTKARLKLSAATTTFGSLDTGKTGKLKSLYWVNHSC